MPENPFIQATTPVKLKISAKKIPAWTLAYNQMHALEVPASPVASSEPTEEITLTPFGSENIRISNFPVIGIPKSSGKQFKEDFSHTTLKNWLIYGGSWYIKDGAFHSASNKGSWGYGIHGSKAIASGTLFGDLSYEALIRLNSKGNAGLLFRVTDQVIGADAYDGYYLGINASSGKVELGKSVDQKWVLLASKDQKLETGKAYKVRIEAKGSSIEVYFNDKATEPLISVTDTTFKSGTIGVRAYDALTTIDDLLVKELKTRK